MNFYFKIWFQINLNLKTKKGVLEISLTKLKPLGVVLIEKSITVVDKATYKKKRKEVENFQRPSWKLGKTITQCWFSNTR